MSSKAKIKGYRNEILVRDKLIASGIPCERVPLSGLIGGIYADDLCIPSVAAPEFRCEVKSRAGGKGFTVLEKWMGASDIMFIRKDRTDPMVVLSWSTYLRLMQFFYKGDKVAV